MKQTNVVVEKSVRVSTKGKNTKSPVAPKQSKIKIAGVKIIDAVKKGGTDKPYSKAKTEKAKATPRPASRRKGETLDAKSKKSQRQTAVAVATRIEVNPKQYPDVIPEFADVLPPEPVSYAIKEQLILRDGVTGPLHVCRLDGKTVLLDDHMVLDLIVKHGISDYYLAYVDSVNSVSDGILWIVENSNSFPNYNRFQRIEIVVKAEKRLKELAKQNQKLGGTLKGALSKSDKPFQRIDCLAILAKQSKTCRQTVTYAKFILKYGQPEDKEKCRQGKAIAPVYKDVKEKRRRSKEYKEKHNAAYDGGKYENPEEGKYLNQIIQGDSKNVIRDMQYHGVKDVAALVTSSPYNIGLDYGPEVDDSLPHEEYIDNLAHLFYEASKLGRDGMRLINVFPQTTNKESGKNRDFKHSLFADLYQRLKELNKQYDDCNLLFWGHFNWFKNHAGGRTCQGSMNSASPVLRFDSEYIGVWVKNTKKLENIHGVDSRPGKKSFFSDSDRDEYVMTTEEYFKYTLQTWQIPPVHDHKYRHQARFHEEIPHRLIKLFTYPQDVVIDPFCGSGTTCYVAKKLKRKYIGVDIVPAYCKISRDRLAELDGKEEVK